ncbi:MAG: tetratricopeptide repeat protein [Thaumarchaeota archaeon]|nr:tetratricopeptide repeat protein [Nitrososphaerota archaeon]
MAEVANRPGAIMFTEMVSYPDIIRQDEPLAKSLLEKQRSVIRQTSSSHGGLDLGGNLAPSEETGLKGWLTGGGVKTRETRLKSHESLVLFDSALNAARCAVEVQRLLREYNSSAPNDRDIYVRIGIHLGEFTERDGEISGETLAVASRIALLAEPEGISISERVYNMVRATPELRFVSLGSRELKNVQLPMEVYKIVLPWEGREESLEPSLDRRRIAVLPLVNMISGSEDEYFADGMTEELISTISNIGELSVISRTSAMKFKGGGRTVAEIGRELRAGTILEGSVRKSENRIRITVQLIDAVDDKHLWAQSYDREFDDVFAIQSDIAKQVADALKVRILPNETRQIEKEPTKSTEAHTLYLKGRYYWNERTRDNNAMAAKYFEKAISIDPTYAPAYVGLADCYIISGDYGWIEPRKAFPKAKEYISRALEIDPGLAEPHASLGVVYNSYEAKWKESEEEFKRAIELKPSYAIAHMWYGLLLMSLKRFQEAYEQIEKAGELDPLSRLVEANLANTLVYMGKPRDAAEKYKRLENEYPEWATVPYCLGLAYSLDSRTDEGIAELRKAVTLSGGDPGSKSDLACVLAFAGQRAEASKLLGELVEFSKTNYLPKIHVAKILLVLARMDEAFASLDGAYEEKSATANHGGLLLDLRVFPWFEAARKDPRWAHFERRLGLR